MSNIQYLIIDTECLKDYWSFQYQNEEMKETKIVECYIDQDFYNFYEILKNINRPMYFYSIDYDSVMINFLCKLVEKQYTNIASHLRNLNNLIIKSGLQYFKLNKYFWVDQKGFEDYENALIKTKQHFPNQKFFLENYSNLLGKSKVFKQLNFNSIPKIMYYYNTQKDKSLVPSISLKNLQLINEGYQIKFDFNKYDSIEAIKKDGLYEKWIEYSKNDVSSLKLIFNQKPLEDIQIRLSAIEAVQRFNPEFRVSNSAVYSENNTELITSILQIENPENVDIDYCEHIKTNHKKFNKFVEFCNNNKNIIYDKDLKMDYCETFETNYIDDDYNINYGDVQINSFDELQLKDLVVKTGLGGCHGAIPNYISSGPLTHLDYASQYPSTILQYKEYFSKFINVKLYEQIYNLKAVAKKENNKMLEKGVKLILNSAYGLINSNFKLSISNKILGRFVCLKGQSLLLNLIDKLTSGKVLNVNTDGIIIENLDTLPELVESEYYKLGIETYKKLIQSDVNNYILDYKTKGKYNPKIKNQINKNEVISNNIENAVKLIQGKEIEIKPVYFNTKYIGEAKPYYFNKNGTPLVKNLKQPIFLTINGEKMLFSDQPDLETYEEYAEQTKQKILNFTLNTSNKKEIVKYYEYELIEDLENYKNKSSIKRKYMKLLSKKIGISGFKGDLKADCIYFEGDKQRIITPLSNYNMTDIMKSTDCLGLTLHDLIIIDVDIYNKNIGTSKKGWKQIKNLLVLLKESGTFEVWNKKTEKYNRKFVFKGNLDFKVENKYFEIIKKGVIYSFDGFYSNNDIKPIEISKELREELKKYERYN